MKIIKVKENDINQRLDLFLKKMFPQISRTLFIKWIRNKDIKINDQKCQFNQRLKLNDVISIYFDHFLNPSENTPNFLLANCELNIVFEDSNIIVVNKPINLVCHDANKNTCDTLINRIKKYMFNTKQWNYLVENQFEPSLVNRIDQNTTGLVVACKNMQSLQELNNIFKNHELIKKYKALVYGKIGTNEWETVKLYINDKTNPVKIYNNYELNTKVAITKFRNLAIKMNYSLLDIQIITGRKHQIRASFNFLGCPIVGEQKYCNKKFKSNFKSQCLVAYYLKFNILNKNSFLFYLNKLTFEINDIWFLNKLD